MHFLPYSQSEEFQNRSRKLREMRELGIEPYPHKYLLTKKIEALSAYLSSDSDSEDTLSYKSAEIGTSQFVVISGRLILFRPMGKNIFAQIQDITGKMQVMFNRDFTKVGGLASSNNISPLKFIEKKLDLGDILGVEGHLFKTQRGEPTVFVKTVTILCKSLLPLPDKHSGLVDKETRYRKRWLDLLSHPETLELFRVRSRILVSIRNFFAESGFDEVETPVLQSVYGGADARPFSTHLHALHQDMYLRIALELSLRKLIVGGMEKIYEIGKNFRNEGIDRTHNPEFTMLEAYAVGWDYNDMMQFTENLFETIALELFGDTKIRIVSKEESSALVIDLKTPWKRMSMKEAVKVYGGMDTDQMNTEEMKDYLVKTTHVDLKKVQHASKGSLIAIFFEEFAEKHLVQPHHIIDHPIETTPFCKPHRDPELKRQGLVERFESFVLSREMCNAYTELNDPELQYRLLVEQSERKKMEKTDLDLIDKEFVEAIHQGMPPTAGLGIGIDRLVMLFTKAESIRDVLFFPLMRSENPSP